MITPPVPNHPATESSGNVKRNTVKTSKVNPIMQYFEYAHLPEHLQTPNKAICDIAKEMDKNLVNSHEKLIGLRKLLEAKDCFVRAYLTKQQ